MTAEIENTPLFREANDIINNGQTGTNFGWRVIIHLSDTQTMRPIKVKAISNTRDYAKKFTDVTTVSVYMGLGQYARDLYPNRDRLQITLQKLPQAELSESGDGDAAIESERFSATLLDEVPAPAVAQGAEANDKDVLDLTDMPIVNFQIFNKALEQVRMVSVGGIWRNCNMESLLQAILTKESQKVDVNQERAMVGVDIVPASNTDKHAQVVISHGVKLVDVPDYLQKRYGIYSSGLGSYVQNKYWHLFPLYDTTQFNERQQTMTILVMPQRKYSEIERTYRQVGDSLTVLMTGETGFKDDSGSQYLKDGNGARFADAGRQMESVSNNTGNKAIVSRARNANEFMTDKRPDGINHVPVAKARITSNPFPIYSELAGRNGGLFKGVWQNSDPKLILPGMMVRIIYSDQDETKEMYGVVHGAEHISIHTGDVASEKFATHSVVYVFVQKPSTDTDTAAV